MAFVYAKFMYVLVLYRDWFQWKTVTDRLIDCEWGHIKHLIATKYDSESQTLMYDALLLSLNTLLLGPRPDLHLFEPTPTIITMVKEVWWKLEPHRFVANSFQVGPHGLIRKLCCWLWGRIISQEKIAIYNAVDHVFDLGTIGGSGAPKKVVV